MRDASIICELRAALRRNGVWGARAERLMQEWTDHVREDAAQRLEGSTPAAAQDAAWKALGNPEVLAAKAGSELARASWLGRHPWLAGLALPALAWIVVVAGVLFIPPPLIGFLVHHDPVHTDTAILFAALMYWQHAFNWLPWLLSMAWLARIAVRMPGGWKLFWVTAIALMPCSTSLQMMVIPRLHGPGSGSVNFYPTGMLGVIGNTLGRALGYGPFVGRWSVLWQGVQAGAWIQTAIMLLGVIAFHREATAPRRAASEAHTA